MNKNILEIGAAVFIATMFLIPASSVAGETISIYDDIEMKIIVGFPHPNLHPRYPKSSGIGRCIGVEVHNDRYETINCTWNITCNRLSGEKIFTWSGEFDVDAGPDRTLYWLFCRFFSFLVFRFNTIYRININVDCEDKNVSGSALGIFQWVIL